MQRRPADLRYLRERLRLAVETVQPDAPGDIKERLRNACNSGLLSLVPEDQELPLEIADEYAAIWAALTTRRATRTRSRAQVSIDAMSTDRAREIAQKIARMLKVVEALKQAQAHPSTVQ